LFRISLQTLHKEHTVDGEQRGTEGGSQDLTLLVKQQMKGLDADISTLNILDLRIRRD